MSGRTAELRAAMELEAEERQVKKKSQAGGGAGRNLTSRCCVRFAGSGPKCIAGRPEPAAVCPAPNSDRRKRQHRQPMYSGPQSHGAESRCTSADDEIPTGKPVAHWR